MIAERKYKRLTPELRAAAVQTVAKVATEVSSRWRAIELVAETLDRAVPGPRQPPVHHHRSLCHASNCAATRGQAGAGRVVASARSASKSSIARFVVAGSVRAAWSKDALSSA